MELRDYLMDGKAEVADKALAQIVEEWTAGGFVIGEFLDALSRYFVDNDENKSDSLAQLLEKAACVAREELTIDQKTAQKREAVK